jgi:hypothetical protein
MTLSINYSLHLNIGSKPWLLTMTLTCHASCLNLLWQTNSQHDLDVWKQLYIKLSTDTNKDCKNRPYFGTDFRNLLPERSQKVTYIFIFCSRMGEKSETHCHWWKPNRNNHYKCRKSFRKWNWRSEKEWVVGVGGCTCSTQVSSGLLSFLPRGSKIWRYTLHDFDPSRIMLKFTLTNKFSTWPGRLKTTLHRALYWQVRKRMSRRGRRVYLLHASFNSSGQLIQNINLKFKFKLFYWHKLINKIDFLNL